jgi:hypothetical protein
MGSVHYWCSEGGVFMVVCKYAFGQGEKDLSGQFADGK